MNAERDLRQTTLAKFDGPERRRRPRYLFSTAMTIRSAAGLAMPGISVEISEKGMSAMVSGSLKLGDRVELASPAAGQISALVRHKLGQLYGFEFIDLSPERARSIMQTCKNLAK
jgi:PilZ domain